MNLALLKQHWPVLLGKLHQRYGHFEDHRLAPGDTPADDFLDRLARAVGHPARDVEHFLETTLAGMMRAGNLPLASLENEERLGNPRGSRDLPPGPATLGMTQLPDEPPEAHR